MPVRSLKSSILKWPDVQAVDSSVRSWAREISSKETGILEIGYFGSYARGDWGVGSDLDLIVIVKSSKEPFGHRSSLWDTPQLPVPCDLLVYTEREWDERRGSRFYETVMKEAVWVWKSQSDTTVEGC